MQSDIYDKLIEFISKPTSYRQNGDAEQFCNWFTTKSQLFQNAGHEAIVDIIRNCDFLELPPDSVVIKQGDKGDCFYVLLSGRVSVFVNTEAVPDNTDDPTDEDAAGSVWDTETEMNSPLAKNSTSNNTNGVIPKKPLDRTKYGNNVLTYEPGQSFGELALINKDCIRNASIICDDLCHLLVVYRDLYNRYIKADQEAEFNAKQDFVNNFPLFSSWQPRYKRQVIFSLRKEQMKFNMPIVSQGDPVNGLAFIVRGQAKVVVDVLQHYQQYPQLNLNDDPFEVERREQLNNNNNRGAGLEHDIGLDTPSNGDFTSSSRPVRRNRGQRKNYAAAEQRRSMRHVEISIVSGGEIIGDIEKSFNVSTYAESFIVTMASDVYFLDEKNYDRLISAKKNTRSLQMLEQGAEMKMLSRISRSLNRQVPLIRYWEYQIAQKHRESESTNPEGLPLVVNLPTTTTTRTADLIKSKRFTKIENKNVTKKDKKLPLVHDSVDFGFNLNNNKGKKVRMNGPLMGKTQSQNSNNLQTLNRRSMSDYEPVPDWEVNNDNLLDLEQRVKNWHLSMIASTTQSNGGGGGGGGGGNVGRESVLMDESRTLHRFQPQTRIHPGKTIILREKRILPSIWDPREIPEKKSKISQPFSFTRSNTRY